MESRKEEENNLYTPHKVIIPSKEQTYSFEKNTYRENYLDHLISKTDYDVVIEGASKIMGRAWGKKKVSDQIKLPRAVISLAVLALILALIYMILLYISIFDDTSSLFTISIICVSLSSIISAGLTVYNFSKDIGKFRPLDQIISDDLNEYFSLINKKFPNLFFEYIRTKRWIEINIHKVNEKAYLDDNKHNVISEKVDEEPEENEEDKERRISSQHSRAQSMSGAAFKNVNPSLTNSRFHSRAQSSIVKKTEEVELHEIKENKNE
jgi:hypothetical protein